MNDRLKVYFPVESVAGLGHLNRAGQLVRAMIAAGMEVTVASGTFVDATRFFPGANLVTLPDYVHKNKDGTLTRWNHLNQKEKITIDYDLWQRQREQAHRKAVLTIKPDIVMVEFWPFSRRHLTNEVNAIDRACRELRLDPVWISSVRDVIKGKVASPTKQQKAAEASVLRHLQRMDAVIVHGDPALINLAETFSAYGRITPKLHYSGYVVADLPQRDLTIPDSERPVLVHAGSGSSAESFFMAVVRAWEHSNLRHHPWHFVTGPRFSEAGRDQLYQALYARGVLHLPHATYRPRDSRNDSGRFRVDAYRPDLMQLMTDARISVSLAGYNTTLELMALSVRALLIPKFRDGRPLWVDPEQSHRLKRLKEEGLVHSLDPKKVLQPQLLAAAIESSAVGSRSPRGLKIDGSKRTAELLLRLHDEKKRSRLALAA